MSDSGLPAEAVQKITGVFEKHPGIQSAILYGSRAKGTHHPGSDIDLTLLAPDLNLTNLFQIETEIDELLLPYKVDLSLFHLIENSELIEHIRRVGRPFFTRA